MHSAKQEVEELLKHLPDDSTLEDIQDHLYVLEKIRRGRDDIRNGRRLTPGAGQRTPGQMAQPLIWSSEALDDIEAIADCISPSTSLP